MEIKNNRVNSQCEFIRDLMPLYIDGVISSAGHDIVQSHLKECHDCRAYCRKLKGGLRNIPSPETESFISGTYSYRSISDKIRREKLNFYGIVSVIALTLTVLSVINMFVNRGK